MPLHGEFRLVKQNHQRFNDINVFVLLEEAKAVQTRSEMVHNIVDGRQYVSETGWEFKSDEEQRRKVCRLLGGLLIFGGAVGREDSPGF